MSASTGRPAEVRVVEELGRLVGLELPAEDLEPLAEALAEHAQLLRALPAAQLAEVNPALRFDPRWHD